MYDRLPYFYITGGDPILHPDFWKLLGLLKERDTLFTIMGNPFHLTDEICKCLKSCGCQKYQLSLDGMRETHDWFRKPGSFDCNPIENFWAWLKRFLRKILPSTPSFDDALSTAFQLWGLYQRVDIHCSTIGLWAAPDSEELEREYLAYYKTMQKRRKKTA